jgi:hypothetical protein
LAGNFTKQILARIERDVHRRRISVIRSSGGKKPNLRFLCLPRRSLGEGGSPSVKTAIGVPQESSFPSVTIPKDSALYLTEFPAITSVKPKAPVKALLFLGEFGKPWKL